MAAAIALVDGLAATLGPRSEVVVHDLARIPNSIVAISGNLTGRTVGGPITDFLLGRVHDDQFDDHLNYLSTTPEGRTYRSSTMFIRDGDTVFGCLCVNIDVTEWKHLSAFAEWQLSGEGVRAADLPPTLAPDPDGSNERYPADVDVLRRDLVARAIAEIGVPVELLHKKHKLAVVERLEAEGYFLLRESVQQLADALSVTRHSVYNYLNEVRGGATTAATPSSPRRTKK